MYSLSLIPLISKPTRIAGDSATLIDNIFVSCSAGCIVGVLISDISNYLLIFMFDDNVSSTTGDGSRDIKIEYRLIDEGTVATLYSKQDYHDFNEIFVSNFADTIFDIIWSYCVWLFPFL